jgi:hypothetical protein
MNAKLKISAILIGVIAIGSSMVISAPLQPAPAPALFAANELTPIVTEASAELPQDQVRDLSF